MIVDKVGSYASGHALMHKDLSSKSNLG